MSARDLDELFKLSSPLSHHPRQKVKPPENQRCDREDDSSRESKI